MACGIFVDETVPHHPAGFIHNPDNEQNGCLRNIVDLRVSDPKKGALRAPGVSHAICPSLSYRSHLQLQSPGSLQTWYSQTSVLYAAHTVLNGLVTFNMRKSNGRVELRSPYSSLTEMLHQPCLRIQEAGVVRWLIAATASATRRS